MFERAVSQYISDWFPLVDAFDSEALLECLEQLKANQPIKIPEYDFKSHQRCSKRFRKVVFEFSVFSYISTNFITFQRGESIALMTYNYILNNLVTSKRTYHII